MSDVTQEMLDRQAERMAADWAARKDARDEVMDRLWAAGYRSSGPTPPLNWHELLEAADRRRRLDADNA